jgi:radical SAM superfamily enzyme YgiQ (UPF0313 family)
LTKNIYIYNPGNKLSALKGREIYLPAFWSQAKTYYEKTVNGDWNWINPLVDIYDEDEIEIIKDYIRQNPPDIFGISLYVWNAGLCHKVAAWVKQEWPDCVVVSGGPHQYVKTDTDWFVEHPYIDASLPGDCYGEWCIAQIIQQLDQGSVNWDQVDNVFVPDGKSRIPLQKNSDSRDIKRNFDYAWPTYAKQQHHIEKFIQQAKQKYEKVIFFGLLETTRGCPYGCVFCDWGGGINSKVRSKDIEFVKQDLQTLTDFKIDYLVIADANFGILGDRDVEIIEFIKYTLSNQHRFLTIFGGMAKTNKRLDTLRTIAKILLKDNNDVESYEIKFSIQTFDEEVLANINRVNITLQEHLEIYNFIDINNPRLSLYVEMMLGLPGITLEKFYSELDILYKYKLRASFYNWELLPEAPGFSREYIEKFQLKILNKKNGYDRYRPNSDHAIVIGSYSYDQYDYLEMLLAQSWYFCILDGGIFSNCINHLSEKYKISDIIRHLIKHTDLKSYYLSDWEKIYKDPELPIMVTVPGKNEPAPYYDKSYIGQVVESIWFWNKEMIESKTKECFLTLGCEENVIDTDIKNIVQYKYNLEGWKDIVLAQSRKKFDKGRIMLKNKQLARDWHVYGKSKGEKL